MINFMITTNHLNLHNMIIKDLFLSKSIIEALPLRDIFAPKCPFPTDAISVS